MPIMREICLLIACVLCMGNAWRTRPSTDHSSTSPLADNQKRRQSATQAQNTDERQNGTSTLDSVQSLLAYNPTAAFNTPSLLPHSALGKPTVGNPGTSLLAHVYPSVDNQEQRDVPAIIMADGVKNSSEFARVVYEVNLKKQGEDHPDTLASQCRYGVAVAMDGRWDEYRLNQAQLILKAVIPKARQVLGPENPDVIKATQASKGVFGEVKAQAASKGMPSEEKAEAASKDIPVEEKAQAASKDMSGEEKAEAAPKDVSGEEKAQEVVSESPWDQFLKNLGFGK